MSVVKWSMVTVQVERVGDWWSISSADVRGLHSQSRTLSGVEGMAIDAARLLGKDVDTVVVEVLSHAEDVADLRKAFRAAEEANGFVPRASRCATPRRS